MNNLQAGPDDRPISPAEAADLRHDLVSPLNLIIGYCDLLGTEPIEARPVGLTGAIHAIRQHGLALLRSIDRALLHAVGGHSTADLRRLGPLLGPPCDQIVAACDRCLGPAQAGPLGEEAQQDLARIRAAGLQMSVLAHQLAAGECLPVAARRPDDA